MISCLTFSLEKSYFTNWVYDSSEIMHESSWNLNRQYDILFN